MATLLQCIDNLIENISVTDRQEENIKASLSNIEGNLKKTDNDLNVERTFTNGSYERDTIIRPLDDIDLFAVLKKDLWKDEYGNLPKPQNVLTRIKNYLNSLNDYKDKVKQDRPCVTIELSDKNFDILPSFSQEGGGYLIPNYDLATWTFTYPEQLTTNLDNVHRLRNYKIKPVVKVVKYWNRENDKLVPSYHIEETAINIFQINSFTNFEQAIRLWFENAEFNLQSMKFKSNDDYNTAIKRVKKAKEKLNKAKKEYDEGNEGEAIKLWKEVFGKEFPTVDIDEAKNLSKSLMEGSLKIASTGSLSTTSGRNVPSSKGFYGEVPEN